MKTTKFELNVGVNPGYAHQNEYDTDELPKVWQRVILEVLWDTGITVSGIVMPATTVYLHSHGCPEGGEKTAIITGLRNPHYCENDEAWREAVKRAAVSIAKHYEQTTAYLSFSEIEFEYLITGVKK